MLNMIDKLFAQQLARLKIASWDCVGQAGDILNEANSNDNPFKPTQKQFEIGEKALRNMKVLANGTPSGGNEITVSYNGINISISDERKNPASQSELEERCKDILLLMLLKDS